MTMTPGTAILGGLATGTSCTATITSPSPTTHYIAVLSISATTTAVPAISGVCAMWTSWGDLVTTAGRFAIWVGTGATSTGTVTASWGAQSRSAELRILPVTGAVSLTVAVAAAAAGNASLAIGATVDGPSQAAAVGELVLAWGRTSSSNNTVDLAYTPSGWTEHADTFTTPGTWLSAYKIADAATAHKATATNNSTNTRAVFVAQIVIREHVGAPHVVETVVDNFNAASASRPIALVSTPQPGDVVAVAFNVRQSTGTVVPSAFGVSGLTGATWTQKDLQANSGSGAGSAQALWFGEGATAAGTITASWTTDAVGSVAVHLIRGLNATTVTALSNATTGSVTGIYTGPASNAQSGQLCLDCQFSFLAGNSGGPAMLSALAPTTGWVPQAIYAPGTNGKWASAYRIPTETSPTSHRTDFTNGGFSASGARITQWVIGDATDSPPPPSDDFVGWGVAA